MNLKKTIILFLSHGLAVGAGFAAGIYALPILVAPPAPSEAQVRSASGEPLFSGRFRRDLKDSDALHWGEGEVSVSKERIALLGRLAPGPDYKLYLSPEFVETEADFKKVRPAMVRVADIRTFENFIVDVPADVDVTKFDTVIVWCESFGQFITAAKYR